MICKHCSQSYSPGRNGLMLNMHGKPKPCKGRSNNPYLDSEHCDSIDYYIYKILDVVAMPIGKRFI